MLCKLNSSSYARKDLGRSTHFRLATLAPAGDEVQGWPAAQPWPGKGYKTVNTQNSYTLRTFLHRLICQFCQWSVYNPASGVPVNTRESEIYSGICHNPEACRSLPADSPNAVINTAIGRSTGITSTVIQHKPEGTLASPGLEHTTTLRL